MKYYIKFILVSVVIIFVFTGQICQAQDSVQVQELVVLTGEDATTDEMFGPSNGNIHGALTISGSYTDNIYNINVDEKTNFTTSIAGNLGVIWPKAERFPVRLSSYNTAVGGSRFTLPASGSFDRFQAYLLGGFNYQIYSTDSELDYANYYLEGMFQYSLPADISFRIMDKFTSNRDLFEIGSFAPQDFTVVDGEVLVTSTPSRIRTFISNQFRAYMNVDMSKKISGSLTYTNFILDYDEPINDWLDRTDNMLALYLYYHHSPKTSLFGEYNISVSEYETATQNDSEDMSLYGGVKWKGSVKTSVMLKGGYQVREYDNFDRDELGTFTMEAWLTYLYSEKTTMAFVLTKRLEETDTVVSRGKESTSGRFNFDHKFSNRFRAYITLKADYYDYEKFDIMFNNQNIEVAREDWLFGVNPGLQYDFQKWLMTQLSYSYSNRDSNYDIYDYDSQSIYLSLNASF